MGSEQLAPESTLQHDDLSQQQRLDIILLHPQKNKPDKNIPNTAKPFKVITVKIVAITKNAPPMTLQWDVWQFSVQDFLSSILFSMINNRSGKSPATLTLTYKV